MKRAVFEYPVGFTTLPDYTQHNGEVVEVVRELRSDEYAYEGDKMFEVKTSDGWVGVAWESELKEMK